MKYRNNMIRGNNIIKSRGKIKTFIFFYDMIILIIYIYMILIKYVYKILHVGKNIFIYISLYSNIRRQVG